MSVISERIERALKMPDHELPKPAARSARPQLSVLGQFMATALGSICRAENVAPSLVGTVDDVRDLIAYRLGMAGDLNGQLPLLATGWRAEVVGQVIGELLAGKLSVRITDPHSDEPLTFIPCTDEAKS
jgi:ribonuclease D